jgi:hypothetical protein
MELASLESIRALLGGCENPTRLPRVAQDVTRLLRKAQRLHCKCGQCQQCLDNERWERIFTERFADPDYYTRPVTHIASPLTSH